MQQLSFNNKLPSILPVKMTLQRALSLKSHKLFENKINQQQHTQLLIRGPAGSNAALQLDSEEFAIVKKKDVDDDDSVVETKEKNGEVESSIISNAATNFSIMSDSLVEVLMSSFNSKDEEESSGQDLNLIRAQAIGEKTKLKVGIAVSSKEAFQNIKATLRSTGVTTEAGTRHFVIWETNHRNDRRITI